MRRAMLAFRTAADGVRQASHHAALCRKGSERNSPSAGVRTAGNSSRRPGGQVLKNRRPIHHIPPGSSRRSGALPGGLEEGSGCRRRGSTLRGERVDSAIAGSTRGNGIRRGGQVFPPSLCRSGRTMADTPEWRAVGRTIKEGKPQYTMPLITRIGSRRMSILR